MQESDFRITNYISKHRNSKTRYEIDVYLLQQGNDAREIDVAWRAVSGSNKRKKFSLEKYLFPTILFSNFLSWISIFFVSWESDAEKLNRFIHYSINPLGEFTELAYQWGLNPLLFFFPLFLWTLIIVATVWNKNYKTKYLKEPLLGGLVFMFFMAVYTFMTVTMASSRLNWAGPIMLTISLVIGMLAAALSLKYLARNQETSIYSNDFL